LTGMIVTKSFSFLTSDHTIRRSATSSNNVFHTCA
jgi:hypothetical protein